MNFLEYLAYALGILFFIYLAARVGSAAFYESKRQYERMKHGTQKQA